MLIIVLPSIWGTEGPEFKSRQPDKQIPCLSRRFAAAGVSKRTAIPGIQPHWVAVGRKGWGPHHGPPVISISVRREISAHPTVTLRDLEDEAGPDGCRGSGVDGGM